MLRPRPLPALRAPLPVRAARVQQAGGGSVPESRRRQIPAQGRQLARRTGGDYAIPMTDDDAITPDLLLRAYAMGIFPMAPSRDDPEVHWIDPRRRGVFPLDGFRISRSLARSLARGDYAATVTRLQAAVPPGRLMIEFFERLLTAEGLARVWAFLGIGAGRADFGRPVHEGLAQPLPAPLAARMRAALRPQYDFVARLMPDLPAAWAANNGEVTP